MNVVEQHYRDYYDVFVKKAYRALGDFHLAEDCVQETYERALKYYNEQEGDHLGAWMNVVYFNTMLKYKDFIRNKGVVMVEIKPDTELLSPIEGTTTEVVEKALETFKCPERLKKALFMFLVQGYTAEEVSVLTGAKLPAIDYRTRKFKKYLRGKYEKY